MHVVVPVLRSHRLCKVGNVEHVVAAFGREFEQAKIEFVDLAPQGACNSVIQRPEQWQGRAGDRLKDDRSACSSFQPFADHRDVIQCGARCRPRHGSVGERQAVIIDRQQNGVGLACVDQGRWIECFLRHLVVLGLGYLQQHAMTRGRGRQGWREQARGAIAEHAEVKGSKRREFGALRTSPINGLGEGG